jgi:predicted CoA-binding protein
MGMQEGMVNKEIAARAKEAGDVVMDRCMPKEHQN